MDDAAIARRAAREALADIEPDALRDTLDERLAAASMAPGALTLVTARAFAPDTDAAALGDRAAGVQLIYEGLALTRRLSHEEPWANPDADEAAADLSVVAADVLVSRGFYLLARSPAAERAVGTVRAFGRDQTARESAPTEEATALDRNLEADVFELAAAVGAAAADATTPPGLFEFAAGLARGYEGDLPAAGIVVDADARERLREFPERVGPAPGRTDP